MKTLTEKREIILRQELLFANAIGSAVFEKPQVSFWMILIPFLFLYFLYRMQAYKTSRTKFDEEFMTTRRRAMDAAFHAVQTNAAPDMDEATYNLGLPEPLQKPYRAWLKALIDYYMDLLAARGDGFEPLVRTAYRNRTEYLLTLNRLTTVEREYYAVLKPQLAAAEGAAGIIETIESQSQRLRRELAEQIFN